jgi:uncharacterized protein YbaR (Trm112 family)
MHILLTDRLACPRCGPGFGLILLAHYVRDRRVLEGDLGCPNCRETYPVRGGFADLRPPPRTPLPPPAGTVHEGVHRLGTGLAETGNERSGGLAAATEAESALRLGALLGVTEGPGMLFLKGPAAQHGKTLADLIGQVEVVGMDPALRSAEEEEGLSRMVGGAPIPFLSGSFRGVLLSGDAGDLDVDEACRVVAPHCRVVVLGAGPDTAVRFRDLGFSVLLQEDGVLIAAREGEPTSPLIPLRGPPGPPTLP